MWSIGDLGIQFFLDPEVLRFLDWNIPRPVLPKQSERIGLLSALYIT